MKKNLLILVTGYGATGKTTLSKMISTKLNIPVISTDGLKEVIWNGIGCKYEAKKCKILARQVLS